MKPEMYWIKVEMVLRDFLSLNTYLIFALENTNYVHTLTAEHVLLVSQDTYNLYQPMCHCAILSNENAG